MSDEKYISSKQAAKMTGYSSDYVGQLCRLGKVRSKRIGRDWMISERSILNYKNEGNQLKNIKNNLSARFGEIYKFYALARQIFSIRKSRLDEWDKALFENKRPKYNFDLGYLIRPLAFTAIFMAVITGFILNLGFISKLAYQVKNDVAQIDLPSLPSFSLPEIPEIAFPKLAMPKITLPKISIPKIALPEISLPEIALPEFSLPKFSLTLPQFNLPNIENLLGLIKIPTSPKLSWPNFSLPKISFPNISLARLDLARLAALPSLPFTWEDSRLAVLDLKNRFLDNLFSWKDYLASLGGDIKIIAQDFLSIKPSSTLGVESPKTPSVFPGEGSKIITFASSTPLSSSLPLTKGEGQVGGGGVKEIRTVVERVLSGVSQSELDQKLSQFNQIILSQIQLSLSALEKRLPSNQVQNPVMFLTTSIPGPYASSPPQTGSGVSASFGDFSSGISTGGNLTASGNIILGQDNKTVEITSSTWKITSGGAASGFTSLSTNSLSSGNLTVNGTETLSGNLTLSSNLIFSNQSTTTIPSSLMNALTFATSSASVPFFTFDTKNYRIGIGTTSPSATFSVSGDILASGGLNVSGASMNVNSTTTLTEQLLVTKSPTVAHSFGTWSVGVANSAVTDAVVVINPASATADTNLFGAAVGGAVKFLIDADGDVFANGLTTVGGTTLASTTASTFTVENQFIMGDAPNSDSHIFKGRVTHFATTTGAAYTIWNSTVSGDLLRLQTGATDPTTSFVFSAAGQAAFGTTTVSGLSVLTIGATTTSSIPLTLKGFTGQAANLFQILDSGNAQLLTVSSGGSVGIGTTTPSNLFSVHGNGLFSGNLSLANLTATGTLSVTGIPTFSALGTDLLTAINSSGALVSTSTPTAARYFATSSIASIFPYASTTAITSSGTASTTNLTVSSLLSGRVPYITTAGLLADSSGLTWNNGASRLTAIYASTTAISGTNIDFGTLTLTNALAIASGGTNASSFTTSGNAVYYNGTSLLTAPLGSAITIPYATTTGISSSQGATFATVSGNVGIGTTSPASLLSVAGAGYFTGNVGIGTANPVFTKLLATSVAGKSDRDGRGDAAQFYGATDINKGTIAVFDSSTAETVGIGGRIFLGSYNTSGDFSSFGSIGIARENAISGNYASSLTFRTTINGANEAETMRITSAGNVGIGTTTPGALLDLTKTSSGATADMLFLSNDASATSTASRLSFRTKDLVNATSTGAITGLLTQNFNGGKGDLAFSTLRSGLLTEAMRITDAGNVGIGTTSPISLLSVQGNCVTGDTRLRRRRRKKKKNGEYEYEEDEVMIKDIQPGDEIATLDETTGKISWQKVKALLDMGVKTAHRLATADGRQIRTTKEHPYLVKDLNGRDPKHSSPINGAGWVAAGEIKAGEFIAVPKPKVGVFIDDANMFYAQKKAGWRIDYGKLRELLAYSFEVKFMNYYLAMPGVSDTAFKKTEKFLEPFRRAFGSILTFRTKPLKYIYDEERKEWIKKGNVDSEVLLDVLDRLEELDVVVIMSGDSDYKALAQTLAKKGKKVLFAGFEDNMAWELRQMKHLYLNRVREAVELGANKKAPEKTGVPLLSLVYSRQELLSSGDVDNGFVWARVDGVEKVAEEQVYDIEVEGTHNFIGNDIVAHNTYVSGTGFFGGAITATSTLNVTGLTTLGYASTTQIGSTGSAYFATSGGNVGIGTTSPAGKLDVNGDLVLRDSLLLGTTVESEGLISWSGTNFVIRGATDRALSLGSNGVNSRILIDTVGNVGIGTTTPNSLLSVANTGTRQLMLTDTDGGVDLKHMYIESADGTLRFGEFNDALTTATERIRIDASGNVGIGTTSPVGLLSVEMGTNQFPFWVGDEGTSTPAFVVRGSGNIGIGTGAPAKLLDVNGGMIRIQRSNDAVGLKVMNTDADAIGNRSQITMSPSATFTGETEGSYIYSIQETVNAPFQVGLGFGTYDVTPQDRMIIKAGGNVGIGTTTPNSILNIAGATPKFTLTDNNAGANLKHWFLQSTGGAFRISTTSDALVDQTAPPPFVITSGGNIGIGTTSPYELFSVSGRAVITATTTIGVSSTAQQAGINIGFGGLCVDNDGTCVASTTGRISSVTSTTGNTDVAEIYLSDEILEKGDIVAAAGGTKVKKASLDNLAGIIGVVSTDPGVILGLGPDQTAEANYPIALVGRVPVKVNLESGPIKIGDRITSSSVAGVGTRATTSGMTVGIALEPFSDAATTTGKILVFVNLGYSKLDSEIAGGNASGWIVDQASGRIKTSYTLDMDNKDIVNARRILSASGLWSIDENGKLIVQEIQTQKLTVTGPQGITIYDEDTGTPYCLKMKSGQIVSVSGTCVFNPSAPSASSTPSAPPADTTPPTITILGNNPAIINIGASYADPGITITDNVDQNLGYTASLDGGPPLSQGAGLSLDTSTTTTHAILYTATDNAGNSANATRIVQVTAPL